MTEEEYFRKHYPDVCYNGKPLSPYWDLFQDGVEFGERQSETKIEELENKIADIKANCDLAIEGRDVKIKELEQELTVEKDLHQEEVNLHLHAEEYIKSLERENAELKEEIDKKQHLADVRLEQELETYQKLHIKSKEKLDTEIALDEVKDQLTKAKEIIKDLMCFSVQLCDCRHTVDFEKTREQAEQFIKEIEKWKK